MESRFKYNKLNRINKKDKKMKRKSNQTYKMIIKTRLTIRNRLK